MVGEAQIVVGTEVHRSNLGGRDVGRLGRGELALALVQSRGCDLLQCGGQLVFERSVHQISLFVGRTECVRNAESWNPRGSALVQDTRTSAPVQDDLAALAGSGGSESVLPLFGGVVVG